MTGLLRGKHALVVGASSGIGRAIALRLAEAGANVTVAARREQEARSVVGEIEQAGGSAVFCAANCLAWTCTSFWMKCESRHQSCLLPFMDHLRGLSRGTGAGL